MSTKKKTRKPRTEAQKAARRERDRKRREAAKKNVQKVAKTITVKPPVKTQKPSLSVDTANNIHVGVIAVKEPAKHLVKMTVVKEYEFD